MWSYNIISPSYPYKISKFQQFFFPVSSHVTHRRPKSLRPVAVRRSVGVLWLPWVWRVALKPFHWWLNLNFVPCIVNVNESNNINLNNHMFVLVVRHLREYVPRFQRNPGDDGILNDIGIVYWESCGKSPQEVWSDMMWYGPYGFLFFDVLELEDYLQPQMFGPKVGGWIHQNSGRNGFPGYAIKDRPWQSYSSSHLFFQFHTCFLDAFSLEDVRCSARPCRLLLHWRWGWDFMLDAVDEKKHHHLTSLQSYVFFRK